MKELASKIDHTLLKPSATVSQIETLCAEAKAYGFASVCVNPCHVALAAKLLADSDVNVCTVIGFPLGATTTAAKAAETEIAYADGCDEFDMVLNIGALIAGDTALVETDIAAVVAAANGRTVKVILETGLLTDAQKRAGCECAVRAGAHFVKTCTGFAAGSATPEDIALMRAVCPSSVKVKASGGVRTREFAKALIAAGADRIGTSSGIALCAPNC